MGSDRLPEVRAVMCLGVDITTKGNVREVAEM
jgi:hypothetical protein